MVEMSTAVEQPHNDIQSNDAQDDLKDSKESTVILTNGACDDNAAEADSSTKRAPAPSKQRGCSRYAYSREEMLILEKTDLALLRPLYLDVIFDRDGRWDPMAWHCGQPQIDVDAALPVGTLEFRKRTRSNAADTKDAEVILSPQRMSFGNGCAGSKVPPPSTKDNIDNNKRLNGLLPKTKFDKNSERTRDPDREKHLQKINGHGYSGNREQIRKAIRDLHENRDRNKDTYSKDEEESWLRNDYPGGEYKQTYKDTKYSSNGMPNKRHWNPRRNSERSMDDEPEWFTSGPTSRLDTIELKGFEDDDKLHSNEAGQTKEDSSSKGREDELAMDPLGNPEMTSASNQYANESMYSTGLQEDWDPTNAKFNVDALLDPDAFVEEGKDLLEAEKSINMPNNGRLMHMDFWAGNNNTSSSPKEFTISPVQRPDSSPAAPGAPFSTTDVHFGENIATCNLKAMLGVNESGEPPKMPQQPGPPPQSTPVVFDARNGVGRPSFDDPIIRQLLQNDRNLKSPGDLLIRPDLLAQAHNMPRNIRDMLLQRSQSEHLPPPGPMLPHPGPVMAPRHPAPELLRDPRLAAHDHRHIDPRLVDPRFNLPSPQHNHMGMKQGPPRNGQELLKAVKNNPAKLDEVINCLQNTLKLGQAPPENQPAMAALLRDMEKAKSDNLKLQRLQMLTNATHHHLNKHPDQIQQPRLNAKRHSYDLPRPTQQQLIQAHLQNMHDKTQALKALLRLPGQGAPLMTAPARMAPVPPQHNNLQHKDQAFMRPRMTGDESIPTRITQHADHRLVIGNKPHHGFPMAFTPTSVMIKSSEVRNFMKNEDMDPNINLTPSHMQPSPQNMAPRIQYRSNEIPNGRRSPRYDDGPKPVPTIETSRGGAPKLHFPPSAFNVQGGPHGLAMKNMPPPNFMMHQLAKGMPPQSPHGPHIPSQLLMHELMHSNKPPTFNHNIQPTANSAFPR